MQCGGVVEDVDAAFSKDNTAVKCLMCQVQTPQLYDVIIGTTQSYEKPSDHTGARLEQLTALNAADKFAFWEDEFDKCIKCYACRQVCPLCYCEQCIVDKTTPRWIESSASLRGNFTWNAIRAFHLAGRCVGCGECERACPMDIPLMLLNRKMGMIAMKEFNYRHGTNPEEPTLVGSYNISDHEDFIK
jgi:ferredoxin